MTDQPQPRPRKGCLFYGCLTLVIIFLAIIVGGGLGVYVAYKKVQGLVAQYSASTPMELPEAGFTRIDREALEERLRVFARGLAAGTSESPLVLTGKDLNVLMTLADDSEALSEHIRFKVEENQIKGMLSLKLDELGVPLLNTRFIQPLARDRYLNGEATFKVSLDEGVVSVSLADLLVGGRPVPDKYLSGLRQRNLAERVNQDANVTQAMEKVQAIEIRGETVSIVPKAVE